MNISNKNSPSTELVKIGNIGFVFEVTRNIKHNLISPDILNFFDGIQESGESNKDRAFLMPIADTNLRLSIFRYIGENWVVCSDNIFRKCEMIKCKVKQQSIVTTMVFYIDRTLVDGDITGIISI